MLTTIELFAGAGGLALGIEKAGFHTLALNEFDADACATMRINRPYWNVIEGDVAKISSLNLTGRLQVQVEQNLSSNYISGIHLIKKSVEQFIRSVVA